MAFRIQLNDHSEAVLAQMDANVERALTAMGIKAVGLIVKQMESGYTTPHKNRAQGKKYIRVFNNRLKNDAYVPSDGGTHTAIRETGDLMRDVSFDEGITGTSTKKREQFNDMVQDALAGKIEILQAKWIQSHYCEHPRNPLEIRRFAKVA